MAYCTKDDILEQLDEETLLQLTDDYGVGQVDDNKVTRAIADADATIDAYCQGRYEIPLSPVPPKIRNLSVDLAIYHIYSRREEVTPEIRKDRYREAMRFLKDVAGGKAQLGAATPAAKTTGDSVEIEQSDRMFTRDKLKGF